jgi:hypothetical protein
MSRRAVAIVLAAWLLCGCRLLRGSGSSDDGGLAADVDVDSPEGQGYLAVEARQCAQCHQSPNPSDGLLSGQDSPVPGTRAYGSNLTPDPDTGMDGWDAGTIALSVLHAVDVDGGPLCAMPAYADAGMGSDEALSIGAYLKTLTPVRHPVPASRCSR